MNHTLTMNSLKMPAIVSQHHPSRRCGVGQHLDILSTRAAGFLHSQHVVTQLTEIYNHGIVEILVSIQQGHWPIFPSFLPAATAAEPGRKYSCGPGSRGGLPPSRRGSGG